MSASAHGPADRTRRFLDRLTGGSGEETARRMADAEIELFAEEATPDAEIALAMAATLLLRLEDAAPHLYVNAPVDRSVKLPRLGNGNLIDELAHDHSCFDSVARLARGKAPSPDLRLVFSGDAAGVRVDSSGWLSSVGQRLPDNRGNPIAAAFAGALASAEGFKVGLSRAGHESLVRDWRGTVSLWDYAVGSSTSGPALPQTVSLDGTAFVGAGGIASATGWGLASVALTGSPTIVDPDSIDPEGTNLNRHLTASCHDIGARKASLLAALLAASGASPQTEEYRWDELSQERRSLTQLMVVTVDDDAVRRHLQLDMPRLLLNGGTSDAGLYQVTYHDFLESACLRCIARGDLISSGPEESAARALGIPYSELRPFLASSSPLPQALLERVQLPEALRNELSSIPVKDLVRYVCATVRLGPDGPALSAPMLSAIPGLLLAAEIVKRSLAADVPLSSDLNVVMGSVLRHPNARWLMHRAKTPDCECTDVVYQDAFRRKWS